MLQLTFSTKSLLLLAALALVAMTTSGCISVDLFGGGVSAPLVESVVRGVEGPKILILDIDGVITGATTTNSLLGRDEIGMVSRVREMLDGARADAEIKALLLRIDSPGGTVTASEQIYSEILRFKREREIPVLAQFLGTAASGGYYIAMAADEIQAHPTTITGSIGVIFSSMNIAGLMEKLGVEDQTITGGVYKDAGSPYRRLNDEERRQLQSIVDELHARFREVVSVGRPKLGEEDVERIANGQVFGARQALANGLVDRIGTLEESIGLLEKRIGAGQSRVIAYHRPVEVRRNIYMKAPGTSPPQAALGTLMNPISSLGLGRILSRPGFHYLWWPGLGD